MKKNYINRFVKNRILPILCLFFSFTVFTHAQLTITCVPSFIVTCEEDIVINLNGPFVSGSTCSIPANPITVSEPVIDVTNGNRGCTGSTFTFTFSVTNDCGESASCEQVFTIGNQFGPFITNGPANQTVSCSFNASPQPSLIEISGSCELEREVEVVGPQIFGPPECPGTQYVYTYIARDQCGRTDQRQQRYTLSNEGSEFICPPDICVLECPADGDMIAAQFDAFATQAMIVNPCGLESAVTNNFDPNNFIDANCGSGPIAFENATEYQIVTFSAGDDCFDFTSCTALVVVVDNEPPVITGSPQLRVVECGDRTQADFDAWAQLNLNNLSATDACSNVTLSFSPTTPNMVCDANGFAITEVSFIASDECGNTSTVEATFLLENNSPPTFVDLVPNIEINCGETANFIEPTIRDACGNTTVTFVDSTLPGDDNDTPVLIRTYTVTDACGGSSTASQTITVVDNIAPVFTFVPAPLTVGCGEPIDFVTPTAIDECGEPVTITFEASVAGDTSCADGQQTNRVWTATDSSGNQSTVMTTVIQAGDDTPPIFTNVPGTANFSCGETIEFEAPTAMDDCSEVTITFVESTVGNDCTNGQQTNRVWTATDVCGNQSTVMTTVIQAGDDTPPVFTNVPGTANFSCGETIEFEVPTATDDCSEVTITFVESTAGDDCTNGQQIDREWTATDDCGNQSTVTTSVILEGDTEPPVFTFVPETPDVGCNNIPEFETPTAVDNCGNVTITFVEYQSPPDGVICEDGISAKRDWTATDDCGNATTVTTAIWINENETNATTATVSGTITNARDEMIDEVYVMAEGSTAASIMGEMTTDEMGEYNFDLELGQNYTITPARNTDMLNGLSTMDLILLGQHLLEIRPLDDPYKIIAADINNSGTVSSLDMIALRRLILGVDENISNNTSWRFVDADYIFTNPTNPFASTFPEIANINGFNGVLQQDFIGIKIGDLNHSATPNALASGDTRTEQFTQYLMATDARIEKGETKIMAVKAKDFTALLGYQMTLEFDPTKMEILEIIPEALRGLNEENFGIQNKEAGIITTSWNTTHGLSLEDETVLFNIVINARESLTLSEVLASSSKVTTAEAYSEIHGSMHADLSFAEVKGFEKDRFSLYQNYPNPFEVNTKIGFYIDKAGDATLTVYDVDGKIRYVKNGNYENGYHEITLGVAELGEPGMLYYRLNATDRKPQVKKMVWIKL